MSLRIAFVDDNAAYRNEISRLLGKSKLFGKVDCYGNAEDARRGIRATPPDVALVDLGLPRRRQEDPTPIAGIELIESIKHQPTNVFVIALTVFDDDDHLGNAILAGANGYLLKNQTSAAEIERAIEEVRQGEAPMSFGLASRLLVVFRELTRLKSDVPELKLLTPREMETLRLYAEGFQTNDIAKILNIAKETVRTYNRNIFDKLHVNSMVSAVAIFLGAGAVVKQREKQRRK